MVNCNSSQLSPGKGPRPCQLVYSTHREPSPSVIAAGKLAKCSAGKRRVSVDGEVDRFEQHHQDTFCQVALHLVCQRGPERISAYLVLSEFGLSSSEKSLVRYPRMHKASSLCCSRQKPSKRCIATLSQDVLPCHIAKRKGCTVKTLM